MELGLGFRVVCGQGPENRGSDVAFAVRAVGFFLEPRYDAFGVVRVAAIGVFK